MPSRRKYADNGDAAPAQFNNTFPAIEGVFDIIANAIDRKFARVDVSYDAAFGWSTATRGTSSSVVDSTASADAEPRPSPPRTS
jgi:hypothetical protein